MTASSLASAVPDRLMTEILHKTCYVDCPNGCSRKLHPSRLTEHDEMCANITVPCANAAQGCPMTLPRKSLADHAAVCSFHMCSGAALGCTRHDDREGIAAHELSCPLVRIRQYIDSRLRNNAHKAPGGPILRDRQLWGPMYGSRLDSLSGAGPENLGRAGLDNLARAGVLRLGPLHVDNLNSMASSLNTLLDSG